MAALVAAWNLRRSASLTTFPSFSTDCEMSQSSCCDISRLRTSAASLAMAAQLSGLGVLSMTKPCAAAAQNHTAIDAENNFRDLIVAAGPRVRPGDRLKTFLAVVAQRTGLAPRVVRMAWQGEGASRTTITRLREAARHGIRDEATDLAFQLEILATRLRAQNDPDTVAHVAALDETVGILRRMAGGSAKG
jgi:hypothetical protein